MIYLWRKGEPKCFESIGGELGIVDPSVLDKFKFDYGTAYLELPRLESKSSGLYRHKSAEASVIQRSRSGRYDYDIFEVKIKFEKILDAKEFLELFIGGKIWPKFCLNDEQLPSPARHLKGLCREAMGIIRRSISDRFHRIRYTSA